MKDYFPDVHPFFLKILNKPLLEYYIDFCVINNISEIRVMINNSSRVWEEYFEDGTQWGVKLSYNLAKPEDNLQKILFKNSNFCKDEKLFIIQGYQFLHYHKEKKQYRFLQSSENTKLGDVKNGLFLLDRTNILNSKLEEIEECEEPELGITQIDGIKKYFALNISLLKEHNQEYVLPGYNNDKDEFIGKNVVCANFKELKKPIMIGDNVQIKSKANVGPNVILGNNVIIDSGTKVEQSIIYDLSYIGSDLEIIDKIIYKKRLIDPFSGEFTHIVDNFLVSDIQEKLVQRFFKRLLNSVSAFLLAIIGLIPYIFFCLIHRLGRLRSKKREFYVNRNAKTKIFTIWKVAKPNFISTLFFRLSLNKYPLLWAVVKGDIYLVGNHLIPKCPQGLIKMNNLPSYHPGIFDYSDMLPSKVSDIEFELNELYYCNNSSLWLDIKVFFRAIFNRIFSVWDRINERETRFPDKGDYVK
jgi:NDP-sugar pyrophosphorylase family protein